MEIYRGVPDDVIVYVKSGATLVDADATPVAHLSGGLLGSTVPVSKISTGKYKASLSQSDVNLDYDQTQTLTWTYEIGGVEQTQETVIEFTTPYSSLTEIRTLVPSVAGATDEQVKQAARFAKLMIHGYTGQEFGKWKETIWKDGNDKDTLTLEKRILDIDEIWSYPDYAVYDDNTYVSTDTGLLVYDGATDTRNIISPTRYAINIRNNEDVIVVPETLSTWTTGIFYSKKNYRITGTFGWDSVPAAVSEAHKLLIDDWFCGESRWRKKYVDVMQSGVVRTSFDKRAFLNTGNFYVDKLLEPYVTLGFVVY